METSYCFLSGVVWLQLVEYFRWGTGMKLNTSTDHKKIWEAACSLEPRSQVRLLVLFDQNPLLNWINLAELVHVTTSWQCSIQFVVMLHMWSFSWHFIQSSLQLIRLSRRHTPWTQQCLLCTLGRWKISESAFVLSWVQREESWLHCFDVENT